MIKRIMVPLDGSRLAEQALPLARTLAKTLDAELLLVSAVAPSEQYATYADAETAGMLAEAGRLASEQYLGTQERQLAVDGFRVGTAVASARPHMAISSLCDRERIDMVVMTTHGRSGVSRWTMGSVADKVLRTTNTPLILIHPSAHGTPPDVIRRVVVALDGSELAEAALPMAQRVAKSLKSSVHLVRAVVPSAVVFGAEYLPGTLPVLEEMETEAVRYLKDVSQRLQSNGFTVTAEVRTGIPAEVILAEANQPGDIVVMSTHGRSGVDRWFLGSVADAVVRHGDIPVLVLRSWVTLDKPEYEETTPLVVAGIPPVIPVPEMSEHAEPAAAGKGKPARRGNRPEARGRQLR
jgi:nucleotide-binding universal stress UspA family protein